MQFLKTGINVAIWPMAKIVTPEAIALGSNVIIDDFVFLVGGRSTEIGDYVHIASFASITGGGDFSMGDFSGLSSGVRVFTGHEDYKGGYLTNPTVPEPFRHATRSFVKIGKHAVVGANAVILAGITIGEGCAIGAGSVVTKDCTPWTIYAGVPARPIGARDRENIERLEANMKAKYATPLVSICCLTYNHARFIRQTLDAFFAQKTDFPFEIIVHDDASTDGTTEILWEYERRFKGIMKVIAQSENQLSKTGKYPVMNLYRAARGKYIAECDGDDYWTDPRKIQIQADFLEANPSYSICHHDYMINENGVFRRPATELPQDYTSIGLIKLATSDGHGIGLCTRMFRNNYSPETAEDIETMAGDYPTNVYMGTIGHCKYIPGIAPSVYRRLHGGNSWCGLPTAEINRRTMETQHTICGWFRRRGNLAHIAMRKGFVNG